MLKQKSSPRQRYLSRHTGGRAGVAFDLYGAFYPPNHLRIVDFSGDPADGFSGLMTFDRDLGPLPGEMNLWCGERKGFGPELVNPRVVRARFNGPIVAGWPWSWDTSGGDFRGADGCAYALAASGILAFAGGPLPAGKIFLSGISRYDSTTLDYTFSQGVTSTGDASGFWCMDESANTQSGSSAWQPASEIVRVSFISAIAPALAQAGIVAGFTGISQYAEFLSPITWRV